MPEGITIVGLGPGKPGFLTIEAQRVLQAAPEIYLRTRKHPTVEALPSSSVVYSFDDVYERAGTFEAVYAEIASRVVALGSREEGVVYVVPGHPLVGESSVQRILALAEQCGLPARIVAGLSFVEPVCSRLKLDALAGLQIADATDLALLYYPPFNPDLPVLIGQLYGRDLAADVKLVLMMLYPDDHQVTLIGAAGTEDETVRAISLYELDRSPQIDHLTSLHVPPLSEAGSLQAFQEIVAHLRAPEGCPWDREQTHRSLRPFLLEEAYEVLQALDSDDTSSLKEELGDLLLQILLHTQIAIEQGEFQMADIVSHIVTKLIRRHPHVFGDVRVSGAEEVLANWEQIKDEEAGQDEVPGSPPAVPLSLPALARAQALQRRATRRGFDWPDADSMWRQLEAQWREFREAETADARETQFGDLLLGLSTVASGLGVDAESALREAVARWEEHFRQRQGGAVTDPKQALAGGP